MSKIQILRSLVNERLTAAAEEIFWVFERTIVEYEGEIDRQRKLLDVLKPEMKTHKTDPPQLSVCEEVVPPEQQERSPSLGQEEPEPLQIKEEQEELWTSQEGEPLQGLEEADILKLTITPVPVKSEHDEEKPQSSWFNQTQTEENREAEPLGSTSTEQMKTEPDGEDCGVSELASNLDPAGDLEPTRDGHLLSSDSSGTETDDSGDDDGELQSGLNTLNLKQTQTVKEQSLSNGNKFKRSMELSRELKSAEIPTAPCCKVCGQSFTNKMSLMRHVKVHSSDCGLCGKHLEPAESFKLHLQVHSTCNICSKRFVSIADLEKHMRTHTGEKPFCCIICGAAYGRKDHLKVHMRVHTGEKPFSCMVCGKTFSQNGALVTHMRTHSGERPYSCPYCGKRFTRNGHLKAHERLHTGEKPYGCRGCGKSFNQMVLLRRHKCCSESGSSYTVSLD